MFEDLLNKKLTRKEFLTYIGAGVMAVTGVAAVIKALTNKKTEISGFGYGSGPYGGKKK